MRVPADRAPVWAIWLLIAFGAVQPVVWRLAGGQLPPPFLLVPLLVVWVTLLVLAAAATRRLSWLRRSLSKSERDRHDTLGEIEQLQTQNAMLQIVARSVDVPLAFQELSSRLAHIVPCDRFGLALLSEDGDEFQTYTARPDHDGPRTRVRPEVVFKVERTMIGSVIRSREPLIVDDIRSAAPDFLDANVVLSAGFRSALIVPLISSDRAVGTLNLVSRRPGAFDRSHLAPLQPIAELLAVAWMAQQLQMTRGKYRTMEVMSEHTLTIASDINSALQAIIGHCDLMVRSGNFRDMDRDIEIIVLQAKRIAELLEKMRRAVQQRLQEASASIDETSAGA
jgi:transcriptional regulator with GAF, ATPase, and Fis domain